LTAASWEFIVVGGIQGQTGPQLVGGDNSPDRINARAGERRIDL